MTLKDTVPSFLVALAITTPALAGCDAKGNSVSATASAGSSSGGGGGTGGEGTTGGDVSGGPGDGGSQTETGSATTGGFFPGDGECVQTATAIGLEDGNVTDVTAQELLDRVEGAYEGSLAWRTDGVVTYNGAPGPIPLTLQLSYLGGEIRSVDGELVQACDHDGPCPCPDLLEIDAVLEVNSDDGAFEDEFAVTIEHGRVNALDNVVSTRITFPFEPDDTAGTLSRGSFDLAPESTLTELGLSLDLDQGAITGAVTAEAEMLGGVGFGAIGNFAAVTGPAACSLLPGGQACTLAPCVEATGTPVFGTAPAECSCSEPQPYCFAGELAGDDALTRYTRPVDDGFEVYDEVVEFGVSADLGEPWRACADAPEVDLCGCEGSC